MGNEIKFKPATFYLGIVDHLARAVEGSELGDTAAERSGGDQGAKRDHGRLLDRVAQQATTTADGSTELPSGGKGSNKDPGLATTLGPSEPAVASNHHNKVVGIPIIPDSATPTPSTRKLNPDTHLPQQESGPEDPRSIPTHKTSQ